MKKISDLDIKNIINNMDFESNYLKKINNNLNLTKYQMTVLDKFNIDYKNASSLSEIIYLTNEVYNETLDEELDLILNELSERNYYENTNK